MVPGSLRLYLLCTALLKENSESELSDLELGILQEAAVDNSHLHEEAVIDLTNTYDILYTDSLADLEINPYPLQSSCPTTLPIDSHAPDVLQVIVEPSSTPSQSEDMFSMAGDTNLASTNVSVRDTSYFPLTPSGEITGRVPLLCLDTPEQNPFRFLVDDTKRHIHACVGKTAELMGETKDPVEILRTYQKWIMRGRQLETIENQPNDGESTSIFVSRLDLNKTSMEEVLAVEAEQFLNPLDVTFYGEKAEDLGGPRREFFTLILKEIVDEKHELFEKFVEGYEIKNTDNNIRQKFYTSAGILCGLSLLQQVPLPCFLSERQLSRIFDQTETCSEAEEQFKRGFNVVGLVDLINKKPVLKFLLRATAVNP